MKYSILIFVFAISLMAVEGFYSDLFMDGGVDVYSYDYFYAADSLAFDWEFMATEDNSVQDDFIHGTTEDINGVLLYPDGEPRFRCIYTNGGRATSHGNSMGETGRERVRNFFANGGSYTGSCAGAFISCVHYQPTGVNSAYYHIWPGRMGSTGLGDTPTGHNIETDSPLLDYYDFGDDMYIDAVYHTGGGYARESADWPVASEVLLRYDYSPRAIMHDSISCWAYKEDSLSGRLVVIGSHPENYTTGERLHLMMAILQYAVDGNGSAQIKGELDNGITREMNALTEDENPDFTVIGDLQYHHFATEIPVAATNLTVELIGEPDFDFHLFAGADNKQFYPDADWMDISSGNIKTLSIPLPVSGTWFFAVKCASTVSRTLNSWGYQYYGDTDVLNGLPYNITVSWDTATSVVEEIPVSFENPTVFPNPFNSALHIEAESGTQVKIFDTSGKLVANFVQRQRSTSWNALDLNGEKCASGIYHISFGDKQYSTKVILLR